MCTVMACTYPKFKPGACTHSTCTSPVLARAKQTAVPASIGYICIKENIFQNIA